MTCSRAMMSSSRQRSSRKTAASAFLCAIVCVSLRASAKPRVDSIEKQIDSMTPKQRVGQLLIADFDGTVVDAHLRQMIQSWGVGGIVFYRRNLLSATQTARVTRAIRMLTARQPRPFVAIDHEGGTVLRLTDGVPLLPGNMALGATSSLDLARQAGVAVGRGLRRLGFNMNLAPVLDIYSNPDSAIGTRSFGDSPEAVGALGSAFIAGESSERVLSVAKHFVGEGAAAGDSHETTPWISSSADEIAARDLVPFRMAIAAGLPAIMTSHAAAPALTGEGGTPITFSHRMLTGLLRDQMGFRGIVITDVLQMASVKEHGDPADLALSAIDAGADMLLVVGTQRDREAIFNRLCEAYRTGRLADARLRESLRRILKLKKEAAGSDEEPHVIVDPAIASIIAERSLTMLIGRSDDADVSRTPPGDIVFIGPDCALPTLLGTRALILPKQQSMDDVLRRAQEISGVIGQPAVIVGAFTNLRQARVIDEVSSRLPSSRLIAVSLGNPHDVAALHHAAVAVAAYGSTNASLDAVARLLTGKANATGRLPITLTTPFATGADWSMNLEIKRPEWPLLPDQLTAHEALKHDRHTSSGLPAPGALAHYEYATRRSRWRGSARGMHHTDSRGAGNDRHFHDGVIAGECLLPEYR